MKEKVLCFEEKNCLKNFEELNEIGMRERKNWSNEKSANIFQRQREKMASTQICLQQQLLCAKKKSQAKSCLCGQCVCVYIAGRRQTSQSKQESKQENKQQSKYRGKGVNRATAGG